MQYSQASSIASSQSKHGPLIVRGSLAMCLLASKSQPARRHTERGGDLCDGRKRGLASTLFPLANDATTASRVKRSSELC